MSNTNQRINYSVDGTIGYYINDPNTTLPAGNVSANSLTILEKTPNISSNVTWAMGGIILNFPGIIQLTSVALAGDRSGAGLTFSISNDSTNGYDGAWTTILPDTGAITGWTLSEYSVMPIQCTWLKIVRNNLHGSAFYLVSLYIFGEYQGIDERFQFWNAAGNAQLTGHYPLVFPQSTMLSDYNEVKSFTIKNTSDAAHTYAISITSLTSTSDTLIANYWRLSLDGGTTKASAINTPSVAAGAISGPITVCANFLKSQNPGDGYHYFYISVIEV